MVPASAATCSPSGTAAVRRLSTTWCGAAGSVPSRMLALIRDTAKLAEFERFSSSMRLGTEPAAPHHVVDNRLTAAAPLGDQVAALVGTRPA